MTKLPLHVLTCSAVRFPCVTPPFSSVLKINSTRRHKLNICQVECTYLSSLIIFFVAQVSTQSLLSTNLSQLDTVPCRQRSIPPLFSWAERNLLMDLTAKQLVVTQILPKWQIRFALFGGISADSVLLAWQMGTHPDTLVGWKSFARWISFSWSVISGRIQDFGQKHPDSKKALWPLKTAWIRNILALMFQMCVNYFAGERGWIQRQVLPDVLFRLRLHPVHGRRYCHAQHILQCAFLLGRWLLHHRYRIYHIHISHWGMNKAANCFPMMGEPVNSFYCESLRSEQKLKLQILHDTEGQIYTSLLVMATWPSHIVPL